MIDVPTPPPDVTLWLVCDEFLGPSEARMVVDRAFADADAYRSSGVMDGPHAGLDSSYRRSTIRYHEPASMALFQTRLMAYADSICERLRIPPFPVRQLEMQLVCSGDGEYYKPHRDNNNDRLRSRRITCVYYLHREPRVFDGGDLRIYAPSRGLSAPPLQYVDIEPRQNRLVAFPSSVVHEVRPVSVHSNRFEDRRFALSAWLHA